MAALSLSNGKRKYLYAKTRNEATDKLKSAQRVAEDGIDLSAERLTIAQFLDKWRATIRRIEQHDYEPTLATAKKLASALSIHVEWLIFGVEPAQTESTEEKRQCR